WREEPMHAGIIGCAAATRRRREEPTTARTGTDGVARDERGARRRFAAAPVAKNGENASVRDPDRLRFSPLFVTGVTAGAAGRRAARLSFFVLVFGARVF